MYAIRSYYAFPLFSGLREPAGFREFPHDLWGIVFRVETESKKEYFPGSRGIYFQLLPNGVQCVNRQGTALGVIAACVYETKQDVSIRHQFEQAVFLPLRVQHHAVRCFLDGRKAVGSRCRRIVIRTAAG